jgi:hypothetical protein
MPVTELAPRRSRTEGELTTRAIGIASVVAVHASTPHEPPRLRIGDISISLQRNRNKLGIDWQTTSMRLYAPVTAVTWSRVNGASHEALCCDLVRFTGYVIDLVEWIADVPALKRALTQSGQGNR